MNDRDVLKRASEALRDTSEPSAAELAALRARVLSKKVAPLAPRARSKSLRWLLPLAAALVTGSALAATPGAWQGLLEAVERYLPVALHAPAREATQPSRKRASRPPAPPTPAAPAPGVEQAAAPEPEVRNAAETEQAPPAPSAASAPVGSVAPVSSVPPARPAAPRVRAAHSEPAARPSQPSEPAAAEAAPAPVSAPSAELALYRPAHELHFRTRSYGAALAAWDAYLSRFPDGTLALEAEYNRALCLVRLGRYAEARSALAPFAAGARGGGYRRSEATRFLEAMEKVP